MNPKLSAFVVTAQQFMSLMLFAACGVEDLCAHLHVLYVVKLTLQSLSNIACVFSSHLIDLSVRILIGTSNRACVQFGCPALHPSAPHMYHGTVMGCGASEQILHHSTDLLFYKKRLPDILEV